MVTAKTTPVPNQSILGCGESSSLTMTRNAAARRPISMPLLASAKEQPQAAKATTVRVAKSRRIEGARRSCASSTVVAQMLSADRTWETRDRRAVRRPCQRRQRVEQEPGDGREPLDDFGARGQRNPAVASKGPGKGEGDRAVIPAVVPNERGKQQ